MHSLHPIGDAERLDRLTDEYQSYLSLIGPGLVALRNQQQGADREAERAQLHQLRRRLPETSQTAHLRVVPPLPPVDLLAD